jgi:hypothetical protein
MERNGTARRSKMLVFPPFCFLKFRKMLANQLFLLTDSEELLTAMKLSISDR